MRVTEPGKLSPYGRFVASAAAAYFLFGTAWIVFSDQLLLAVVDAATVVRLSTIKGLAFVAVTTMLLVVVLRTAPPRDTRASLPAVIVRWPFAVGVLLMLAAIVGIATPSFLAQSQTVRETRMAQLAAVARHKARDLADTHEEQSRAISGFARAPDLRAAIERWGGRKDATSAQHLSGTLRRILQLSGARQAQLLTPAGDNLLGPAAGVVGEPVRVAAREAMRTGGAVFVDVCGLHLDEVSPGYVAPIIAKSGRPLGALYFGLDADRLFQFLRKWPLTTLRGSIEVAHPDGNDGVIVIPIGASGGSARIRLPRQREDDVAVRAVIGGERASEGLDFRGQAVLAAAEPVAGTAWTIIAKADREVVFAETKRVARATGAATAVALGFAALIIAYLWQRQQLRLMAAEADLDKALRENEARWRLALEIAGIGTWRHDMAADTVHFDSRAREHFAAPDDIVPRRRLMAAVHPDDLGRVEWQFSRAVALPRDKDVVSQFRVIDAAGAIRHIRMAARVFSPGVDPRRGYVCGISWDVSGQVRAQQAVADSRQLLLEAQTAARIGSYSYDIGADCWTNSVVMDELFGIEHYSPKTAQSWLALVHPDDRDMMCRHLADALAGRVPCFDKEYRIRRALDDQERWMQGNGEIVRDAKGRPLRMVGTIMDITERKQAQIAFQQRHEELQRAQAIGQIGSWHFDIARNRLTWSDETYRIFGTDSNTPLTYESFLAAVHPDDRILVNERRAAAEQRGEPFDVEHRIVVDGAIKWIQTKSELEFAADGSVVGGRGTVRDITDLKRAFAEIEQSRNDLQALTASIERVREDERRRIAREVHDELGQTLLAAKLDIFWLKDRLLPGQDDLAAKLADMAESTRQAIVTVRRISQEMHPSILDTLDLSGAVGWLVAEFRKRMGIRCTARLPQDRIVVSEEVTINLFRICQELLTNVGRHADANRVDVALRFDGGNLELSVADNGRGIEPRPGRRSLGLISVRERVALLKGKMEIETVPAIRGTRITVCIPIAPPSEADA